MVLAAAVLLALLAGCRRPEPPPRWPEPGSPEKASAVRPGWSEKEQQNDKCAEG